MKTTSAPFGKISVKSWLRGLYYAILTAILPMLVILFNSGQVTLAELKPIGLTALSVGTTYILTHLLTNSNDEMFTTEKPAPVTPENNELKK